MQFFAESRKARVPIPIFQAGLACPAGHVFRTINVNNITMASSQVLNKIMILVILLICKLSLDAYNLFTILLHYFLESRETMISQ